MRVLHKLSKAKEILTVSQELKITTRLLPLSGGLNLVKKALERFKPFRVTGHLSIGHDESSIPTEENEFIFPEVLGTKPIYVFFDQEGFDRDNVVAVFKPSELSLILKNSYGMEYFLTNKKCDFLISVNWYAIEATGSVKELLKTVLK